MTPAEKLSKKKPTPSAKWGSRRAARRAVAYPHNILRKLRESLGLTQRDVSVGSGTNNATIADSESGFEMTLTTALKLAKFYGKSIEELWTPKEKK